ncbi:hypothetical protein [Thermomonospora amylolytica]|uniref:hypothetical protein n=1 Tax=Thermomonospora amylolytica TaxID=1411117 RepID=UPI00130053EF|nr:hypothetical protein [Thermomonospora amylolytica]
MSRPARQAIVAVYRATFPQAPDWAEGPLPLIHNGIRADTASRSTYYPPRTARLLYGTPEHLRRWHRALRERIGGLTVIGLEALRLNDQPDADGLIIIHLSPGGLHGVDVVRALAGRNGANLPGYDPARLVGDQAALRPGPPFTLAFVTARGWRLPRLFHHPRYLRWPYLDQWQWALASRSNYQDQPPDPRITRLPEQERIWISADWSALVLREGMALTGTRPDRGASDPFYNHAALYARTIYLDAILIGLLQLHGISELEDTLAATLDGGSPNGMPLLERRLAQFRHQLWWQHLSAHGAPNQFLEAFHRQHRLPERFAQILAEINDYNRLAREDETRNINGAVLIFTLVTVPAGIALALLQVLSAKDLWIFTTVFATCLLLTGLLLATGPARSVLRSMRSPHKRAIDTSTRRRRLNAPRDHA